MEENKEDYIDLIEFVKKLWDKKLFFFILWVVTFIVSCIIILPIPRQYQSTVRVAPETSGTTGIGALGSLASSFGINIGANQSADAFFPDLYPDLISTNNFIVDLFSIPIHIEKDDEVLDTDYLTYMRDYQKVTYYKWPKKILVKWMHALSRKKGSKGSTINPNKLDREMDGLVESIRKNISCSIDKKTGVISITVWDQNADVAAMLADTIIVRLQNIITDYRTQKARNDEAYYNTLLQEALAEYKEADTLYTQFCEKNWQINSPTIVSQKEQLANMRNIKLSTYNAILNQHQMALAKIQENTPAFTTLERPNVAPKASKPKRLIFVLAMLVLATFGGVIYLFKEEVLEQIKHMR